MIVTTLAVIGAITLWVIGAIVTYFVSGNLTAQSGSAKIMNGFYAVGIYTVATMTVLAYLAFA